MDTDINTIRESLIQKILSKQDSHYRWGFDETLARERPVLTYYEPIYKATLWTLLLLADIKAPTNNPQIIQALQLITNHFYDQEHGIFTLGKGHFPVPCLNGNMLYLHFYFKGQTTEITEKVIKFFNQYQRFDDGDFKTPKQYPYCSNKSCYGKHSCYWGVIKLMKGLSFIPKGQRSNNARELVQNCIDFVLLHEVCYSSHQRDQFLHKMIARLTIPNLIRSDYLEILWILKKAGVRQKEMSRAIDLLASRRNGDGSWNLEHPMHSLITSVGRKNRANVFVTERALEVMDFWKGGNSPG